MTSLHQAFLLGQHGNEINDVVPHPSKGAGLLLPWIRQTQENIRTLSHNNTFSFASQYLSNLYWTSPYHYLPGIEMLRNFVPNPRKISLFGEKKLS